MANTVKTILGDESLTILVTGMFTFPIHREFRDAYRTAPNTVKNFVVDLAAADNLDSSALGMLLQLNEFAADQGGHVEVTNCNERVLAVLKIAHFETMFDIT
ncbi:MAG: STAS domain-containing protein [Planctomycetota bacterium]